MLSIVRQTLALLPFFLLLPANGCSDLQKSALYGKRTDVPQSQAVDWGPLFKLQITKCSWEGSDLVVDLSMAYSGNDPGVPTLVPVFQLESTDGKHFVPSNGGDVAMKMMTTNYNPGTSRNFRLTFPAAHADYTLLVEDGGTPAYVGIYPSVGIVVYVWHIQPTGG